MEPPNETKKMKTRFAITWVCRSKLWKTKHRAIWWY